MNGDDNGGLDPGEVPDDQITEPGDYDDEGDDPGYTRPAPPVTSPAPKTKPETKPATKAKPEPKTKPDPKTNRNQYNDPPRRDYDYERLRNGNSNNNNNNNSQSHRDLDYERLRQSGQRAL